MTNVKFVGKIQNKEPLLVSQLPYGTYFISRSAGKEALFFKSTVGTVNLSGLNKGGGVLLEDVDYMDRNVPIIRILESVTITEDE
jgi:hypothetical protein